MKVAVYENALDIEVYRACIDSLKTHVATPGVVGNSLDAAKVDSARIADVRYLKDTTPVSYTHLTLPTKA